jgi:quinol monooxygenase YgiN
MFAVIVTANIKPEQKEKFLESMFDDARGSVQNEPNCLLFNIVQDHTDPNCIHLYEVYRDAAAFAAHEKTPHFVRWVEATKNMLAKPLDLATGTHLFPSDESWQKQPSK